MDLIELQKRQEAFETTLRRGIQGLMDGKTEPWLAMYTDDATMEFPYAPDGAPRRLEGKAAIAEYLRDYPKQIAVRNVRRLDVRQTLDPEIVTVEMELEGKIVATNQPYAMTYVSVVRMEQGLISEYRDYWNPLVAQAMMNGGGF